MITPDWVTTQPCVLAAGVKVDPRGTGMDLTPCTSPCLFHMSRTVAAGSHHVSCPY